MQPLLYADKDLKKLNFIHVLWCLKLFTIHFVVTMLWCELQMNCEIDAAACSASLTEDSSGMEMDFMLTVSMVPDALALEKGIGWVWLWTSLSPWGWNRLNCAARSLFVDCYNALFVCCVFIRSALACQLFPFLLSLACGLRVVPSFGRLACLVLVHHCGFGSFLF